jgi:hypothetical protein
VHGYCAKYESMKSFVVFGFKVASCLFVRMFSTQLER